MTKHFYDIKPTLLFICSLCCTFSVRAQSIDDTPPAEQYVCVDTQVTYFVFGFPGSTIEWHVKEFSAASNPIGTIVLSTTPPFVSKDGYDYIKGEFNYTWTSTGTYTLQLNEITQAGCESGVTSTELAVNVCAKPAISTLTPTHIICDDDKGSIKADVTASVPAPLQLQYRLVNSSDVEVVVWTNDDDLSHTFNNLAAGDYKTQIRYVLDADNSIVVKGSLQESGIITINAGDLIDPVLNDLTDLAIEDCADDETTSPQVKSFTGLALPAARYSDNCSSSGLVVQYKIQLPDASYANDYGTAAADAVSASDPSGYKFPEGVSTIYFKVRDESGNESEVKSYTISVDHKPKPSGITF